MTIAAFQKRLIGTHGQRIAWTSEQIARIARHYGVDASKADLPAPMTARRAPALELNVRDTSADGRIFTFTASTGEPDRMNDTINQNGWQLDAFKKNPVILFAHDSGSLPVGRATSVGVKDGKLIISVRFAQTGLGKSVAAMVSDGFLKATSVGFIPLEFDFATGTRIGGIDFKSAELLELSIVPIPANSSCLLVGISGPDGKSIIPLAKTRARRERTLALLKLTVPTAPRPAPSPKEQRAAVLAELTRVRR